MWKPIASAPLNKSILITNGELVAIGKLSNGGDSFIEPEWWLSCGWHKPDSDRDTTEHDTERYAMPTGWTDIPDLG